MTLRQVGSTMFQMQLSLLRYCHTRSTLSSQDEISKLLELILNKRKSQLEDLSSDNSNRHTDDYDLNSKLDCVICQTNVEKKL